ncbi:hypothetical protein NPIL_215341 [Nephila pilipes]|uniref:Uncharacterized protein n=1 Tax=Nephila pilipes TaxID=299642 RepID=A0A8X6NXB4_NEPPI|nr:hypothetical protein NPIL_215341 [Nephila pilipes]
MHLRREAKRKKKQTKREADGGEVNSALKGYDFYNIEAEKTIRRKALRRCQDLWEIFIQRFDERSVAIPCHRIRKRVWKNENIATETQLFQGDISGRSRQIPENN